MMANGLVGVGANALGWVGAGSGRCGLMVGEGGGLGGGRVDGQHGLGATFWAGAVFGQV